MTAITHPLSELVRQAIRLSGLSPYSLSWQTGLSADIIRGFRDGTRDIRASSIDKIVHVLFPQGLELKHLDPSTSTISQ